MDLSNFFKERLPKSFRAWDIQNEIMVYEPFLIIPNWEPSESLCLFYEYWSDHDDGVSRKGYVMESTGLKIRDKLIFEGDIVSGWEYGNKFEGEPDVHLVMVVKWDDENGKWIVLDPWSNEEFDLYDFGPMDSVIGNIFQNPELIAP